MKFKGKKKLASLIKMSLALISVIGTTLLSNVSVARAEELIHTHIWATKHDNNSHWEYCTICAKTRNNEKHKYTDNWKYSKESCWPYNYSTRVCDCGYSYEYHKEHTNVKGWYNATNRLYHYKACMDCRAWTTSEDCKDNEGKINCKNPGTCNVCNTTYTSNQHYIKHDGTCKTCGIKLVKMDVPTVKYASDMSYAEISVTMESLHESLELTGKIDAHTSDNATKKLTWTSSGNSKRMTYVGKYIFNPEVRQSISVDLQNHHDAFRFNGVSIVSDLNLQKITISPDKEKPTVTEIKQKDQKIHNTWATIKELTITGTENLSNVVSISIKDKITGDIIVDKAEADVKNKKYTYMCTPELEGPAEGRTYILIVEDNIGNKVEKDFVVYKTDCRAPLLRSGKEYTEWSKTKNLELELTDYGSGTPQSSINNQTSYINTKLINGKYFACYTFAEDKYDVSEYKLYVRDGLGNAGVETIKVGRVDNTKPTITDIKSEVKDMEMYITGGTVTAGPDAIATAAPAPTQPSNPSKYAQITVTANDMNKKLGKEGSGVEAYALTQSKDMPNNEAWQKYNVLGANKPGTYYLWVKDKAGNIADLKVLKVKDDFTVEIGEEEIVVDKPEDDKYGKPDEGKDKPKNENKDKVDNTPKTADSTAIYLLGTLLIVSFVIMIVTKRRRRYQ